MLRVELFLDLSLEFALIIPRLSDLLINRIDSLQGFLLLGLDELLKSLDETIPFIYIIVLIDIGDKHVAVHLWVWNEELPEHAGFDVKLTFLSVVVNLGFVHHTFVALGDQSNDEVKEDDEDHDLIDHPDNVDNHNYNLIKRIMSK